ncbi:MAG: hypothetical protein B9S32_08195 [Verrucomicrobia bacterium Tous-C9LFEB]|nr:MAG: hypothetical protein B9S32_08195 [Verrucomicrobia bacterium Tous-C9LFEB]
MKSGGRSGFSLVEVAMALGVVSFALLSLVALLPVGIKTNQISAEETRAAYLLSTLEADLRNTHPQARANGTSRLFGLTLPYRMDATGTRITQNTSVALNTLSAAYSTGLNEDATTLSYASTSPRPRYQATVLYTQLPAASGQPIQARLIVNWPAVNTTDITKLTSLTSVLGYVEIYVTFPAP